MAVNAVYRPFCCLMSSAFSDVIVVAKFFYLAKWLI